MKQDCGPLWLVFAFIITGLLARADISPTQFFGSGIAARSTSSIRMESANVDILWGTPCSLTATFKMVNPSKDPEDIRVGFPMPNNEDAPTPTKAPNDLTITFDGDVASVTPPSASKGDKDTRRDWVWYHCQHKFKPGTTIVVVKTTLRASLVYATPFRETLHYCIETGGNWAGTIGEEIVTIRFPHLVEKNQITSASPASYRIDTNCVRWRLVEFKPTGKEYDISLTYVRPDVMRVLSTLRQEVAQHPDSSAAAIKLAKHLLVLGNARSNSGFPPSRLSKEQFAAIVQSIAAPEDKKTFVDHYQMATEGRYEERDTEWTNERVSLIQILADAGYRDQSSQVPFVLEAERLLKNTVAHKPHNAEAWNIYLASYWRFSFAAIGHWFGATTLSQSQAKLIETAAANCPNDECIRLWLELRKSSPEKRDKTALFEAIKHHGFMAIDFPKIDYGYH